MTRTIADVIREEKDSLLAACERHLMDDCGSLREWSQMAGQRYIWLGGFGRFAEIKSVTADWWVRERKACTWDSASWCCTPDTRVYRRIG